MKSILVIGHGSRVLEVNNEFEKLIEILNSSTNKEIRGANLTLASPSVEDAVEKMYKDGIKDVKVIPYFLSNGTHVIKHIPQLLEDLTKKYKGMSFKLEGSLLLNPLVIKAMLEKIED